ncbi:MAG: AAA family ATPase, partial [Deltaproteobacteria bacterium]|nr:AAA family ATPase [Deltaproteobacteria bacterium]
LLADRQRLQAQIQSQKTDRARLEAELANFAAKVNSDRAFAHIAADLDVAEATAISLLYQQLINQPLAVPEPPDSLQAPVLELENSFQARVQALLERRTALAAEADLLRKERRALRADQAAEWRAHALGLARLRDRALRRISPALASEIYGLNRSSLAEVQAEGAELAIRGLHYLGRRSAQLKRASGSLRTLRAIASLAVSSIELLLFVGLVWWAMRRWKGWMRGVVSAMSRYVHLGGWPLIFARVADALQTCGPPLILAAASVAVYQFLGATESPAEIRVGFEIVFWTALLRGQLRFLEGFADNVSARREQAARDRREEAALDDSVESNDRLPKHEREDYNRAAKLFKRSWKVLTWFVGLFVITIELVQLSMGDGVVAHHLFFFAKVLAIPVLIITVHWWRAMIVTAYAHRIDARSKFASFVIKHGSRWYGAVVALVAMPVLLATRGTRLVREHVAGLNTTRRILAFLFRRQIERHAEKSGKSESIVVELPDKLVELFPHDSLAAETAPLRPPTVDEVETKINAWLESPVDGSAALVGGAGMGKTTILNFLSAELEVEVNTIDIDRKVVKTADLWTTLADKLDLPADTKSEEAAISAIKERYSKAIVAVDNAHNLFLRRVGGFEAWRGLTRLVNATCNDVFWILALNDVAWGYLLALDGGVSPFRSVLVIHGLTEDSLRKVMMSRMRTGRFRTSFSDLLISDQPGMRRSTQIIRTSRGYFSMLWDYTQGNPRLANHFWLKSLAVDDKTARVRLFSTPPIDELEALRDEAAFTLAALVEHENLNATELSLITNLPKDRARFLLQLCHDKGILKSPEVGRFEVSTHWQVAVYRYLRRKNLLYA